MMQNDAYTAIQNDLSFEKQGVKKSRPILIWFVEVILLVYFVLMVVIFSMFVAHLVNQYDLVGVNFLPAVWVDVLRIFGLMILSFFALYKTHQAKKIGKVLSVLLFVTIAAFGFYEWLNASRAAILLNQADLTFYQVGQMVLSIIFIVLASVVVFSKSVKTYFE